MANKHLDRRVALCLIITLPLINIVMLSILLGNDRGVALAQANTEIIEGDTTGSRPAVTRLPHECEAYPFALPEDVLNGLQPGDTLSVFLGPNPDNFRWLYWNPEPSNTNPSYVVTELQNPALSLNDFFSETDPTDRSLSTGDNIKALTVILNSNDIAVEIENLRDSDTIMRVIVYDEIGGSSLHSYGHVVGFILVKIIDYTLLPQSITFTYLGPAEDPEVCRQFGLALKPSQTQIGEPGQDLTYTHILTNQGHYTETALLTYTTSLADWPVSLSLISQTLAAGQAVTFTAAISIPANSPTGIIQTTRITATLVSSPAISVTVIDTGIVFTGTQIFLPVIRTQ